MFQYASCLLVYWALIANAMLHPTIHPTLTRIAVPDNMGINSATFGSAGDFNDDGHDDIIVTLTHFSAACILYGPVTPTTVIKEIKPSYFNRTSKIGVLFTLTADVSTGNNPTHFVPGAVGDFNGDGIHDVVISEADPFGTSPTEVNGRVYVVFGGEHIPFTVSLDKDLDGKNGVVFEIEDSQKRYKSFGSALTMNGDINGDKIADLGIGIPQLSSVVVIFGARKQWGKSVTVFKENTFQLTTQQGLHLTTTLTCTLGTVVWVPGDINFDGFEDLAIACPSTSQTGSGTFVLFGERELFGGHGPNIDLSIPILRNGTNGIYIQQEKTSAPQLMSNLVAGSPYPLDFNGDGVQDMILVDIAGMSDSPKAVTVIFGRKKGFKGIPVIKEASKFGLEIQVSNLHAKTDSSCSIGDINHDGLTDIVTNVVTETIGSHGCVIFGARTHQINQQCIACASKRGTPECASAPLAGRGTFAAEFPSPIACAADWDNDGTPDLLLGAWRFGHMFVAFGQEAPPAPPTPQTPPQVPSMPPPAVPSVPSTPAPSSGPVTPGAPTPQPAESNFDHILTVILYVTVSLFVLGIVIAAFIWYYYFTVTRSVNAELHQLIDCETYDPGQQGS